MVRPPIAAVVSAATSAVSSAATWAVVRAATCVRGEHGHLGGGERNDLGGRERRDVGGGQRGDDAVVRAAIWSVVRWAMTDMVHAPAKVRPRPRRGRAGGEHSVSRKVGALLASRPYESLAPPPRRGAEPRRIASIAGSARQGGGAARARPAASRGADPGPAERLPISPGFTLRSPRAAKGGQVPATAPRSHDRPRAVSRPRPFPPTRLFSTPCCPPRRPGGAAPPGAPHLARAVSTRRSPISSPASAGRRPRTRCGSMPCGSSPTARGARGLRRLVQPRRLR